MGAHIPIASAQTAPASSGAPSVLAAAPKLDLTAERARLMREAVAYAGRPEDVAPRVAKLHQVFLDSGRNHAFPEVALHGALWARAFFSRQGAVSALLRQYVVRDPKWQSKELGALEQINALSQALLATNRQVFLDTWVNYHFSKKYGRVAGAERFIAPPLLAALNSMHDANKSKKPLTRTQRSELFQLALLWEQENSVSPLVTKAMDDFDAKVEAMGLAFLSEAVRRPLVRFKYFPHTKFFLFRNFADKEERIERATESYEIAEAIGWDAVMRARHDYAVR